MVIHKRLAKAIKKRLPKKGEVKHDLPALSDIPAFFPYPGVGALAIRNPALATALATYIIMEATQPYWGPPVEAHGQKTRQQYEAFMNEDRIKGVKATTRKTSKANKAMKKAYAWLIKQHKGKMTQKKCRELLKKASRMASKANPGTKSRIGKTRRSKMLKECKRIRRQVWGTLKRN